VEVQRKALWLSEKLEPVPTDIEGQKYLLSKSVIVRIPVLKVLCEKGEVVKMSRNERIFWENTEIFNASAVRFLPLEPVNLAQVDPPSLALAKKSSSPVLMTHLYSSFSGPFCLYLYITIH